MLAELRIRDLGVIAGADLLLEPGMTAVTGETGAGKTMVVEAIELLVGGRADGVPVRTGAAEAWVEGRFLAGEREMVLARAVPPSGRSRAYVDARMAPVGALAEVGGALVDLHGQHLHQSLLDMRVQRRALDAFAAVDLSPLEAARARLRAIEGAMAALGGDEAARAREADFLRFQVGEIDTAGLSDPGEDDALEAEEELLADAAAHRQAAWSASQALSGDGGALDALGAALSAVAGRPPLGDLEGRLRGLAAEAAEAAGDLRSLAESLEDDPERLGEVRARRNLLHHLTRKYGQDGGRGSLSEVMAYRERARSRLDELESHAQRAAGLEAERVAASDEVARAAAAVGQARRRAAPHLAEQVEAELRHLAMPGARFQVEVGEADPGDEVSFLLSANPGEPPLALAKVASGGELSRAMLAARLVLGPGRAAGGPGTEDEGPTWPSTVVFDEVDAGVGGQAALAVGRSLATLASEASEASGEAGRRQVLVVTHLPQVAAFADHQIAVRKVVRQGRTAAEAEVVQGGARVAELSRMLSGQPESTRARGHAEELLAVAARERSR